MKRGINFRKQNGSLTIEAAIVLTGFIFGYAAIITATSFIRAQMIIQYSISQAAKEISSYCYLASKTGIMEDSARVAGEADSFKKSTDNVIDTVVKLYDAIDQGSDHITNSVQEIPQNDSLKGTWDSIQSSADVTQEEFQKIMTAANTMADTGEAYFSDPKTILKGLGSLVKDGALSAAKSYIIAAPISKGMVRRQVDLYGRDSQNRDILEKLGVVDGIDGLNFMGSTLFNDGETITVQVSYTMKIPYPGFDQKNFHFTQTASTRAWGAKEH